MTSHHHLVTLENVEDLGRNAVINSPRSLESCLRLGIDTCELVTKDITDFRQRFVPETVSKIKHEHYEKRRTESLNEAKRERKMIIAAVQREADEEAAAGLAASDSVPHFGEHHKNGRVAKSASAPDLVSQTMSAQDKELVRRTEQMLEQERARLRKAKARQAAEIKSILDHETYLVQLHHQAAIKEEKEGKKF